MSLDLSNPAHVQALRWACNQIRMRSATLTADAGKLAALDALTNHALAADLLCRLLERCGFRRGAVHGEPTLDAWVNDSGTEIDARTPSETSVTGYASWTIRVSDIPRLALVLLDAKDRAAALAVLRGER